MGAVCSVSQGELTQLRVIPFRENLRARKAPFFMTGKEKGIKSTTGTISITGLLKTGYHELSHLRSIFVDKVRSHRSLFIELFVFVLAPVTQNHTDFALRLKFH